MHVIFDNIIFALQHVGGISVVWQELLRRAMQDPAIRPMVLDYEAQNVCRNQLAPLSTTWHRLPYRYLERYRTPDFAPTDTPIFHSSYFRILPGAHNVTTIHDLTYHYYRKGLAKAVHLWEEERAVKNSERIICVSEFTKQDLLRTYRWLDEQKVRVVHNGVHDAFRPMEQKEKVTPFERGEYLLYVGNRGAEYKQFLAAVGVAKQTHRPLVIVGVPLKQQEHNYLVQQLGEGHFYCCGLMIEKELASVYSQAYCLVYLSDYEGFGIPIVEAQRCGCPVLVQSVSSLPEVAGEGAVYVHHQPNQDLATEAAYQLQQADQQLPILSQKGLQNAQRFSWDCCYQETIQVYQTI